MSCCFTALHPTGSVSFQVATCLEAPSSGHAQIARDVPVSNREVLSFSHSAWSAGWRNFMRSGARGRKQDPRRGVADFQNTGLRESLVELIRCHLFPAASPEIHRQQLVSVATSANREVRNLTNCHNELLS